MVKDRRAEAATRAEAQIEERPAEALEERAEACDESPESAAEGGAGAEVEHTASPDSESEPEATSTAEAAGSVEAIAAAARAQERERIRRILQSAEAAGREDLAGHLATKTAMSAEEAIEMLKLAPRRSNAAASLLDLMKRGNGADERGSDA